MAAISYGLDRTSWTGSIDEQGQATYSVGYIVECDSPDDGPWIAEAYVASQESISIGTVYAVGNESDSTAKANGIHATARSSDGNQWLVTVTYGALTSPDGSPLNEPPVIRAAGRKRTKIVDRDVNGDPIVNRAGLPYEEGTEIGVSDHYIQYTVNLPSTFNQELGHLMRDKVNNAPVTIKGVTYSAGMVMCDDVEWQEMHHQSIGAYYQVTYTFLVAASWDLSLVNAGRHRIIDPVSGATGPVYVGGEPVDTPVYLNADGTGKLADGLPAIVDTFEVVTPADFSVFGLV